jgi:hypothetical protein
MWSCDFWCLASLKSTVWRARSRSLVFPQPNNSYEWADTCIAKWERDKGTSDLPIISRHLSHLVRNIPYLTLKKKLTFRLVWPLSLARDMTSSSNTAVVKGDLSCGAYTVTLCRYKDARILLADIKCTRIAVIVPSLQFKYLNQVSIILSDCGPTAVRHVYSIALQSCPSVYYLLRSQDGIKIPWHSSKCHPYPFITNYMLFSRVLLVNLHATAYSNPCLYTNTLHKEYSSYWPT